MVGNEVETELVSGRSEMLEAVNDQPDWSELALVGTACDFVELVKATVLELRPGKSTLVTSEWLYILVTQRRRGTCFVGEAARTVKASSTPDTADVVPPVCSISLTTLLIFSREFCDSLSSTEASWKTTSN